MAACTPKAATVVAIRPQIKIGHRSFMLSFHGEIDCSVGTQLHPYPFIPCIPRSGKVTGYPLFPEVWQEPRGASGPELSSFSQAA